MCVVRHACVVCCKRTALCARYDSSVFSSFTYKMFEYVSMFSSLPTTPHGALHHVGTHRSPTLLALASLFPGVAPTRLRNVQRRSYTTSRAKRCAAARPHCGTMSCCRGCAALPQSIGRTAPARFRPGSARQHRAGVPRRCVRSGRALEVTALPSLGALLGTAAPARTHLCGSESSSVSNIACALSYLTAPRQPRAPAASARPIDAQARAPLGLPDAAQTCACGASPR